MPTIILSQNNVFLQRLQIANNLSTNIQTPLTIPSQKQSPFQQESPLVPLENGFASQQLPNKRFNSIVYIHKQQKTKRNIYIL